MGRIMCSKAHHSTSVPKDHPSFIFWPLTCCCENTFLAGKKQQKNKIDARREFSETFEAFPKAADWNSAAKERHLRAAAALHYAGNKSNSSVPLFKEGFDVTGISCSSLKEHQRYLTPSTHDIHCSGGHVIGNASGSDVSFLINALLTASNVINYPQSVLLWSRPVATFEFAMQRKNS